MHTIQFDTNTEQELTRLAAQSGKDADQFIKDVICDFLDEQQDIDEAEVIIGRIARGEETTIPWEAIKAEHDL